MSNYYQILQVPETASDVEIRQAYRNLALKWHPDKNPGNQAEANEKFKELSNAYEILSDPVKRQVYDQGRAMAAQGHSAVTVPFGGGHQVYVFRSPEDVFKEIFGDETVTNIVSGIGYQVLSSVVSTAYSIVTYFVPFSYSYSVSNTVIQDGRRVTTKTTVTNGVTVSEVFVNNRLVSSITRNG